MSTCTEKCYSRLTSPWVLKSTLYYPVEPANTLQILLGEEQFYISFRIMGARGRYGVWGWGGQNNFTTFRVYIHIFIRELFWYTKMEKCLFGPHPTPTQKRELQNRHIFNTMNTRCHLKIIQWYYSENEFCCRYLKCGKIQKIVKIIKVLIQIPTK